MTSKEVKNLFHPFEVSFCGYSGSGKTTLVTKLIEKFSEESFDVGYMKHDAHRFQMDKEGKDTFRAARAGASVVNINSAEKFAILSKGESSPHLLQSLYAQSDILFIEGYKKSLGPKILVLGERESKEKILMDYQSGELQGVLALVGIEATMDVDIPYFHRDDISNLSSFITGYFEKKYSRRSRPVKGLILTGGKSRRMGRDKGQINYHGRSQVEYSFDLLSSFCHEVYVSCREDQKNLSHLNSFSQIHDRYLGMGPTGGILSAFEHDRESAWLVLACDLPYVDSQTIEKLFKSRNPFKMATCFKNATRGFAEPLCTIYEPKARGELLRWLSIGKTCPRKTLMNSNINLLELNHAGELNNINTPDEYHQVSKQFQESL